MINKRGALEGIIHKRRFRIRLFFEGILIGLATGTVVVLFRYILQQATTWLERLYLFLGTHVFWWTLLWIMTLIAVALVLSKIVQLEPMISGSGIPQVKGAVLRQLNMKWLKVLVWKFVGGVLAIGSGMSLGREGPSIQLGAVVGQGINRLLGGFKVEERILITSGASAGLAAAFNAPLAGVVFSLEELHKNFSPPILLSAMTASLTADYVSRNFFGIRPIFDFHTLPVLPMKYFVLLLLLGLITGLFGVFFNWSLIKSLQIYEKQKLVSKRFIMLVPLLLTIPVGFWAPQALGGGHGLIAGIESNQYALMMLILLVIIKFGLTMVSYGSGAPGGIFLPLLVIGALTGGVFGQLAINFWHVDPSFANNFVVFAMAAYFTAIVKAPITGSILITEMTGSFEHLPALIAVSMTAYIVADLLKSRPIYDQLLNRLLARGGHEALDVNTSANTVLEAVVCLGSQLEGKRIRDVTWPQHCLLINIKRGEEQIIPRGDTKIIAGDYLNILTNEKQAYKLKRTLLQMAGYEQAERHD
ncbi:MAG: ClC family H(+)/Cl(-) exchange transporter [Firmicutes bacterium HGW-Firmicutes-15]|nr:MAG: ClC family H(+)/Cl(-) exchange transporter [Firmicutes bacterium HGW-Firmicutes-15]